MTESHFRLMLLRHGNTFGSGETAYQVGLKTDLPLTETGLEQARAFSRHLGEQELVPQAIFCGSLKRQLETAKLIHERFPTAELYSHQPALDEIDYGSWEGLTAAVIKEKWPTEYQNWLECALWPVSIFERGLQDHLDLLRQWVWSIEKTMPKDALVVAVSSNGIMRLMLHFIPTLWQSLTTDKKMHEYKVSTGHYCDLVFKDLVPSIKQWNCRP